MEVNTKKKSTFSAISINRITAERFRAYLKSVSKSHSESIDLMIDFFEKTKITPKNDVMISFIKFQNYIIGRFDYIEELLCKMESQQLKPTHDLLKSLFDGTAFKEKKEPLFVDKKNVKMTIEEWNREKGKVSIKKYQDALKTSVKVQENFREFLDRVIKVNPTLGKSYFKLEIGEAELNRIKEKLN
jgi:hypothetical protein